MRTEVSDEAVRATDLHRAGQAAGAVTTPLHTTAWRPKSSLLRFRAILYLVGVDAVAIFGAFVLAAISRDMLLSNQAWLLFASVLVPTYLLAAVNMHSYSVHVMRDPVRAVQQALQALLLAIATLTLAVFYLKSSETFPRLTVALGTVGSALALASARFWFVRNLARIVGGNPFSAILIQDGSTPAPPGEFSLTIAADSYFDPDQHDPAMYNRLAKTLQTADRVVISCPAERRAAWARALQGANIQGEIVVPELAAMSPRGLRSDGGTPMLLVAVGPLDLADRALKRAFDIVAATAALVLLSPVMLWIALLVKLDSPGPVLFRQTRIGRGNQLFQMLKFRSMRNEVRDGAANRLVERDDDRVTRIGRVIRRTSLDELPQLWNVLIGEMSIVGPRPHALGAKAADKLYWEVNERYWHRHATKPGLTGLAQVRGYRGNTEQEIDLQNRLESDLEYLEDWSLWRDLKIIVLTARVLLHRNAF
jgi:polysaccharide biosynthesis protein PslA